MENQIIFGSKKNKKELQKKLQLLAPSKFLNSNTILDFERYKNIEVDWKNLLSFKKEYIESLSSKFKDYLFKFWDNKNSYDDFNTNENDFPTTFLNSTLNNQLIKDIYWKELKVCYISDITNKCEISENTFCLVHKVSERLYYISSKKNEIFKVNDIQKLINIKFSPNSDFNSQTLNNLWSSLDILEIQFKICYEFDNKLNDEVNKNKLQNFLPYNLIVDRSILFYQDEIRRLNNELKFYDNLKELYKPDAKNGDSLIKDIAKNYSNTLDSTSLEIAKNNYLEVESKWLDIKEKLRIIKSNIELSGKFIAIIEVNETDIIFNNNTVVSANKGIPGDIYQIIDEYHTYNTTEVEYVWRRTGSIRHGNDSEGYVKKTKTKTVTEIRKKAIHFEFIDPLKKIIDDIKENTKNQSLFHYSFIKTPQGYVNENDSSITIKSILKKCELDEKFRLSCIISVVTYDFILSEKKYPRDAKVFVFPLPNLFEYEFPDIKIRESLSYRIAWEGAELGQLVNSINLAPGETRQITLSTSFTQQTTKSSSIKSTSEMSTSNSFDLSSELQNEASTEINKKSSFSANAGFSFGGFGGGASGGTDSNIRTFTKDMSKLAKKASSNINRKLTSEINESSSQSISINQSSSKTSTISNINQGSTLNLMIYQINNKFKSGLFIEQFEISLIENFELIPNSGLIEEKVINFKNKDRFFEYLYNYLEKITYQLEEFDKKTIELKILKKIISIIEEDYRIEKLIKSKETIISKVEKNINSNIELENYINENNKLMINRNDNIEKIKEKYNENKNIIINVTNDFDNYLKNCEFIDKNLFEIDDELLESSFFTINSGAFYIDSLVGMNPATEPYSESMRNLEKEKISDKNKEQKIKNQLLQKELPFISKISNDDSKKRSIIHLSNAIKCKCFLFCNCNKQFKVYIDNKPINNCKVKLSKDNFYITIDWNLELPSVSILEKNLEILFKNHLIKFIN